jgi:periplasmic protein TonB
VPTVPYEPAAPAPVSNTVSDTPTQISLPSVAAPEKAAPKFRKDFSPISRNGAELDFPTKAKRDGIESGNVRVHVSVGANGRVQGVNVISSNPPRVFDAEVRNKIMQWLYAAEEQGFVIEYDLSFRLE